MTQKDKKQWYKHFWPWYLIGMKVSVITACIVTGILIYKNPISMVVDDYYNEGRSINLELKRIAEAEERDISFYADIDEQNITLRFRGGEPADRTALKVTFYHPTMGDKDFSLRVPHSGEGIYRQMLPRPVSGHWRIDVEPFDGVWRISQNVFLPNKDTITLIPVNYGI